MNKKEKILQMYFEEHKKQEIIAETIGVSQSYISQVVKKDTRYTKEKEIRHNKSMQKKAEYNREYYKNYERPKKDDNSYEQLKALLNKDNAELSFHNNSLHCNWLFVPCMMMMRYIFRGIYNLLTCIY